MQSQGGGLASFADRQVFAQWNEVKISLDARPHPDFYFYEREVWWAALGKNIGHEIDGKNANFERPVLIIKRYSQKTCLILPLTAIKPNAHYQYPLTIRGNQTAILLDQSQTISSRRLLNKIDKIDILLFREIVQAYFSLIKYNNPAFGRVVELPEKPVNNTKASITK